MNDIQISVVIPFYNAKDYIEEAVKSAVNQQAVGEVIIVEDASPDGGIEICQKLVERYSKVRLIQHLDRLNHGAAASRNLGIQNSRNPYIAFLDADDFYLPNRFERTVEILSRNENIDGVYEAIGVYFQDQSVKDFWENLNLPDLTTITKNILPEQLFYELLDGKSGYFSLDGFTVKKDLLLSVGGFNENLRMMEDTDIIYKLAVKGRLYPGVINKPVAMRRVHASNRITNCLANQRETYYHLKKLWNSLYTWGEYNLTTLQKFYLSRRYVERMRKIDYVPDMTVKEFIDARKLMLSIAIHNPLLFFDVYYWRKVFPSKTLIKRLSLFSNK